jgi:hypothetical protein
VLHANTALVDRVDLATRCRCPLTSYQASRLLLPRSGLERSDFVRWRKADLHTHKASELVTVEERMKVFIKWHGYPITFDRRKACRGRPRKGSGRCIYDELQVRIVIGLKTCVRKTQHTLLWMSQALYAARAASNIVGFPPFCKLWAAISKTG